MYTSGSYGATLQVKATICRYKYGRKSKITHLLSNVLYGTVVIRTSTVYIQLIIMVRYGTLIQVLYRNMGTYSCINREGERDEERERERGRE